MHVPGPRALLEAGATAALGLVDPAAVSPRGRAAYRAATTGLTGAAAYAAAGDVPELAGRPAARAGVAVGAAGLLLVTMGFWERVDARVTAWLVDHGATRPRLWIAAGSAALTLLTAAVDETPSR